MSIHPLHGLRTVALALILATASAAHTLAAPLYTIKELPASDPGGASFGDRINRHGAVLGYDSSGPTLFDGGGVTNLSGLTVRNGSVRALNDAGHLTGYRQVDTGQFRGFITTDAGAVELPSLGGRSDQPRDLNNAGLVVGTMLNSEGRNRAAVWTTDSVMDLGVLTPGDLHSAAIAINNRGEVVGNSGGRGFIWSQTTGMRDIGTLGGTVFVNDINDAGWVTGIAEIADGGSSAFIYDGAAMTAFGPIGQATPNLRTTPWAINLQGVVVGESQRDDGIFAAFVRRDGATLDLQTLIDPALGWELSGAYDINDAGQITGTGYLNGRRRGFVLNPIMATGAVPEPGTWALMILGFGVAGTGLRRRRGAAYSAATLVRPIFGASSPEA